MNVFNEAEFLGFVFVLAAEAAGVAAAGAETGTWLPNKSAGHVALPKTLVSNYLECFDSTL